jgi:hypothetical protein
LLLKWLADISALFLRTRQKRTDFYELDKSAPEKSAIDKSAPEKSAPEKNALDKSALIEKKN